MSTSSTGNQSQPQADKQWNWPLSPVPKNPLGYGEDGTGRFVKTAGCLIIGDEVLNGKTKDTNSNFLAKLLFDLGIDLKRIEVIPDEEEDIIEAARRMCENYDLVVTSGGIGPTHDDITYSSLCRAFLPSSFTSLSLPQNRPPLSYHTETLNRMATMSRARRSDFDTQNKEQILARQRMALFPDYSKEVREWCLNGTGEGTEEEYMTGNGEHEGARGEGVEVLFVSSELWVPVVRLRGKVCVLPGVPRLFQQLVTDLIRYIPLPPSSSKPFRHLIHTPMPESSIAPYLSSLSERLKPEGIRIGSYPKIFAGVDVSLIGLDQERVREIGREVCNELKGEVLLEGKLGEEQEVKKSD